MTTKSLTCVFDFDCVDLDYHTNNQFDCPNFIMCQFYGTAWSLPYLYMIIDGIPTLTVAGSPVINLTWGSELAEELDLIIKSAWIEAGWHPAEPIWIIDNWDEIPF